MFKKSILAALVAVLAFGQMAKAQTNLQFFYDFGKDRNILTTTLEGFYNDSWGNTFFFVDYDYQFKNAAPNGTYFELARCFNFWQHSALAPLSLQVEYNGGRYSQYGINHAFLAGFDWFLHSKDFKNTLNLKALYKRIDYSDQFHPVTNEQLKSMVPMQFTVVWGMQDIFGVTGLRFSGFADFWWQDHVLYADEKGAGLAVPELSHLVFISEPQLWYNLGRHIGVDNFNIGGEVELSFDFGSSRGFWARPCLGAKWVF